MNKEIWKDILNYEGLYQVSNFGNVRSLKNRWGLRKTPKLVKQQLTKKGYKRVPLTKENKPKQFMVHRLVYEAFKGKIKNNYEINHKDLDRTNNDITNLEEITHTNNVRYSKAKKIIQLDLNENFIKKWNCIRDVEKEIGIDHRQICDCLLKKQKTCHGFKWKYEEEI